MQGGGSWGAEPSKVYECHAVIWDTSVASKWSTAKLEPPLLGKYWLIFNSWFDFLHFCRFVRFGLWTHEKCRYGHSMVLFFRVCFAFQSLNNFLECWPIDGPHGSCFLVCWLSMDSAVHNLWHVGLSMDRTVHVICGRWVIYRSWDAGWGVLGCGAFQSLRMSCSHLRHLGCF